MNFLEYLVGSVMTKRRTDEAFTVHGSRFTEEQIIGILKEQEAGLPTAEVCRKHGISSAIFYKYKAKYGGMDVSDARKLKVLEDKCPPQTTISTFSTGSRTARQE